MIFHKRLGESSRLPSWADSDLVSMIMTANMLLALSNWHWALDMEEVCRHNIIMNIFGSDLHLHQELVLMIDTIDVLPRLYRIGVSL